MTRSAASRRRDTRRDVSPHRRARTLLVHTPGGRCECCGMGTVTRRDALHGGPRGRDATPWRWRALRRTCCAIRHRGRTIGEVLAMTIDDAHDFFVDQLRDHPRRLANGLLVRGRARLPDARSADVDVVRRRGRSGISSSRRLRRRGRRRASAARRLLIFDEPTTGLHCPMSRVSSVLRRIVARGRDGRGRRAQRGLHCGRRSTWSSRCIEPTAATVAERSWQGLPRRSRRRAASARRRPPTRSRRGGCSSRYDATRARARNGRRPRRRPDARSRQAVRRASDRQVPVRRGRRGVRPAATARVASA